LSIIERNEKAATKELLPVFSSTALDIPIKEIQIEFIQSIVSSELDDLEFLTNGLENALKKI